MIKGTHEWEITRALNKLGYRATQVGFTPNSTLAAWLRQRRGADMKSMFLLVAGNHWIVVQGRKACCAQTKEPVFISKMRKRRARVTSIYRITKTPAVVRPKPPKLVGLKRAAKPCRRRFDPEGKAYREFRKLMLTHGASYDIERDGDLKWIGIEPFGPFPDGWSTLHHCWVETTQRLEKCLADPSLVDAGGSYSE